ncbi:MAG: hydrogenase nickel incorporation protein HypB [candidate division WOR-3 bacterium]|nr:hydrogenase nickel incorporation protein HypB [candidate division WOR-3 bacterium]MCX7837523.1 hydrogenase nickel incorporation protein HypB [candidate division WOR-3 bacterium]MDW8113835.1 hydrogenase nickel incorporation protein HypB [candidate division WOR-3 bacterium]
MKVIKPKSGEIFDIELEESLLRKNRELAEENKKIFNQYGIKAIDILGSIGSGKTTLICQLIKKLKKDYKIGVIAGDLTTEIDANLIKKNGAKVVQINTGKECHLDAKLVNEAIKNLPLKEINLLFIENVGNLICPAEFPVGAHYRIVIFSSTEGPYTVIKHPHIFKEADMVIINKIDLAKKMGVSLIKLKKDIKKIKPSIPIVEMVAKKGKGIEKVVKFLKNA